MEEYAIDKEKNIILDNKIKDIISENKLENVSCGKNTEKMKYYIDIKNNQIYIDLIKNTDFIDVFENFNEIFQFKMTHISSKIENLTKLFLKINKVKKYSYLKNVNFFKKFTADIFLSNAYVILNHTLMKEEKTSSNLFGNYANKKNIDKMELTSKMQFFPKYNNKNSDIADFIGSMDDVDYMIISLFFYIKSNLILSIKKILIDNPDNKVDMLNYIKDLIESLHDLYLYLNCIKEEIIVLNKYIKNEFIKINKEIKNNNFYTKKLKSYMEHILCKIDDNFKKCLNYYYII